MLCNWVKTRLLHCLNEGAVFEFSHMPIRESFDGSKKKGRSPLTNGTTILGRDVDHRTTWSKRMVDLYSAHLNDIGGIARASEGEKSLCKRAAIIECALETIEQRMALADGEASEKTWMAYQRLTNTLRRTVVVLHGGLSRRARDITPTLSDVLRGPPS
jgi:hypothetical protein